MLLCCALCILSYFLLTSTNSFHCDSKLFLNFALAILSVTTLPHLIFNYSKRIRLKQLFTFIIVIRTTLQTDSNRGRVKNLIFNRGRTPPFTGITGFFKAIWFFNRTTSVGDSFMFERENALATNFTRTTYYSTLGWRWNCRGSWRGTFIFIWIVPAVIVTITFIRRWNTFSRIGTCELCWRTLNWNGEERLLTCIKVICLVVTIASLNYRSAKIWLSKCIFVTICYLAWWMYYYLYLI